MTGQDLINYIDENCLEDFEIKVSTPLFNSCAQYVKSEYLCIMPEYDVKIDRDKREVLISV